MISPRRYPRTLEEAFGPSPWPLASYGPGPREKARRMMRAWLGGLAVVALLSLAALVA